jgi:hypothetical protein
MSVLRPKPPEDPISLTLGPLERQVEAALAEVACMPRETIVSHLQPAQLLGDYMQNRPSSRLYEALSLAKDLAESVDAVAVVCKSPLGYAVQSLFEACCHPFHNHLSRGERGGKPRLFFDVGEDEPDHTAGLLDLIAAARGDDLLDRWGLIQLVATLPTSPTTQPDTFSAGVGEGRLTLPPPFRAGARSLRLEVGADQLADVFTPPVLITASVAGIDVVRFLGGGAAMLRRFLESPPATNPPMLLAAALRVLHPSGLILDTTHVAAASSLGSWWWPPTTASPQPSPQRVACELRSLQSRREIGGWHAPPGSPRVTAPPAADRLAITLPRLDEHTLGQLLAMRLVALHIAAPSLNPAFPTATDGP